MIFLDRIGLMKGGVVLAVACFAVHVLFSSYFHQFHLPSFLPFKLYVFIIGAWVAQTRESLKKKDMLYALGLSMLLCLPVFLQHRTGESVARFFLVAGFFYLMDYQNNLPSNLLLKQSIQRVRGFLMKPVCLKFGQTSYGFYLTHMLILTPVAGWLTQFTGFIQLPEIMRFSICAMFAGFLSFMFSWLLFATVETSGIRAGKKLINLLKQRADKAKRVTTVP